MLASRSGRRDELATLLSDSRQATAREKPVCSLGPRVAVERHRVLERSSGL
jgi:hypothetical protein